MAYTFDQIIEIAKLSGIPNNPGSTYRAGAVTRSGKRSHHADGQAVDFMGYSQDALAALFMSIPTMEVFHKSDATGKWYGMSKGKLVDEASHKELVAEHRNHLHVAMNPDQVGPGSILDQLRKGISIVAGAGTTAAGALGRFIPNPGNVTDALTNVGTGIHSLAQSAISVGEFASQATKLFLPTTQIRIMAGFLGVIFILIGIWFLSREIRESKV